MATSKPKQTKGKTALHRGRRWIDERGYYCWKLRHDGNEIVVKRRTFDEREEEVKNRLAKLDDAGVILEKGKEPTMRQHYAAWLENKVKPNKARSTYRSYKQMIGTHITPVVGNVKLSKFTEAHAQKVIATAQANGKSKRTVQYIATIMFAGLGRRRSTLIKEDVEVPSGSNVRDRVMPLDEIQEFLTELFRTRELKTRKGEHVALYRDRYLIAILMNTGLRISEALGALKIRLNLREGHVSVEQQLSRYKDEDGKPCWELSDLKSDAGHRIVPLNASAIELVQAQLALVEEEEVKAGKGYENNGLLFPTESGKPHSDRNVRRTMETVVKRINQARAEKHLPPMEEVTPHDLRRTYLTHLADVEERLQVVASIAGHAKIQTTLKHYVWAQERRKKEAADKVSFGVTIQLPKRNAA